MRTLEVITTYNKKYYDICGKKMIETFIKFWPKDVHLYCYWQEQEPEIFADNVHYIELYKAQPQLKKFVDENKNDLIKCGTVDGQYNFQRDGVKFSHKVFAQSHRIVNTEADILLYLDADTYTHATPNIDYLNEILPENVLCTYFGRPRLYDETGFYMHNPKHPRATAWANTMERIYLQGELWKYPLQVDCYTMYEARQEHKEMKQLDLVLHHGGLGKKHPFVNSPLGLFLDHLKGNRKELGHSKIEDLKGFALGQNLKTEHWKQIDNK
jgi:hypothetical protein|tara:strand:- start:204 stop:1010 length:807 start_codon:yes stop_codon:yes gene_type:complete